jgi:hypothetical protein
MTDNPEHDDYVGFGRPPKSGRFKPGKSGNPSGKKSKRSRGRSEHTQSVLNDVMDELGQILVVRENGREKKISKQRAFVIALINSAIKGDVRAINAVVALAKNFGTTLHQDAPEAAEDQADLDDLDILETFLTQERARRERQKYSSSEDQPEPSSSPDATNADREDS